MSDTSRIAGAGGSDLFGTGTYKVSDGTLNYQGAVKKVHSLITQVGCTITSCKYNTGEGVEVAGSQKLLTVALADNTLVTFQSPVHEIIIVGTAMFFFN